MLRYKATTLKKLSDRLYNSLETPDVTEAEILCVTILLFHETIAGDRVAMDAHMLGLKRMVNLYGGQDHLPPVVAAHLRLVILLSAQLDLKEPILPLPAHMEDRYDILSKAPLPLLLEGSTVLGSGFFSQSLSAEWSLPVQQCLRYMCRIVARIATSRRSAKVIDGQWMDDVLTLEHVLLSLPYKDGPLTQLEECVRTAALLYCNTSLWKMPLYFRWIMSLIRHLKATFLSLDPSSTSSSHLDLYLWMLFVGRQACTIEFPVSETAWWNASIEQLAGELNITTWEESQTIMERFLFVEGASFHLGRWEAVWNDVTQGNFSAEPIRDPTHPCDYL